MTGWNLPPGCTTKMIDDLYADRPCECCGFYPDDCICPECPMCHEQGNPTCYPAHNLFYTRDQVLARIGLTMHINSENSYWESIAQWEEENPDAL